MTCSDVVRKEECAVNGVIFHVSCFSYIHTYQARSPFRVKTHESMVRL